MNTQLKVNNKKGKPFGGGWRMPIVEDGLKWCNCLTPNLTHGTHRGLAWCMRCKTPYYH